MVTDNICHLLGGFLRCSEYENVIFCWVMHMQPIIDDLLAQLELNGAEVRTISLIARPEALAARIEKDVTAGVRQRDVIGRSLDYLPKYALLNTVKVDVSDIDAAQAARVIAEMA